MQRIGLRRGCPRPGLLVAESAQIQVRERPLLREQARLTSPHADEQRRPLVLEAPADEAEHLLRGLVRPVGVVDDRHDRRLSRGHRQQAQRRRPDRERRCAELRTEVEHSPDERRLPSLETFELVAERPDERLERGEGHRALRLDSGDEQPAPFRFCLRRRKEEGGLPDARLAGDHDRRPVSLPGGPAAVDERRQLPIPAQQHSRIMASPQGSDGPAGRFGTVVIPAGDSAPTPKHAALLPAIMADAKVGRAQASTLAQ